MLEKAPHVTKDDFHHYAFDKDGKLIFIRKDVGIKVPRDDYYCIECGEVMRPVQGEIKEWHFRHKNENLQCNKESYLHKLGKIIIKERFDSSNTFVVRYHRQLCCPKYHNCNIRRFACLRDELSIINLKELYDTCQEEKCVNNSKYRADLLLTHSKHPERSVYLEIAYKHKCEPEKIASGISIIEIGVKEDLDFGMPLEEPKQIKIDFDNPNKPYTKEAPPVRFYNFERRVPTNVPNIQPVDLYIVYYDNGFYYPRTFVDRCDIFKAIPSPIVYLLAVRKGTFDDDNNYKFFLFGMIKAVSSGVPIKCCAICSNNNKGLCELNKESDDPYKKASLCKKYIINTVYMNCLIEKYYFNNIRYQEWKRD